MSFSHLGYDDVEKGVLATIAPKNDFQRLSRRIALNVQRSLEGEDPGELSVYFLKEGEEQLVINMESARKIDFYPTFATKVDALLLHEEPEDIVRQLTLNDAIHEALEMNLELLSKEQELKAGEENISIANALRLPQFDLSLNGSIINEDRASAMAFGASEQVFSGSAGLTQLIYSDKANANITIQTYLQHNLEDQLEQTTLDITLLAGSAYLNILRAKTLLTIQKDNLKVTNSNLDVARTRVSVGMAGKGELYRWEAELAGSRQDVLDAENSLKQAEFNLNRILHRAQEELFGTAESAMSDPFLLDENPLVANIDNSRDFTLFRNFAVEMGLENAPELAQIDSAIDAQKRLISSLQREYTIPSVALQGDLTGIFAKGGEGSDGIDTEGLPPALADAFSSPDDVGWFIGVGVSLPVFSGGGKRAEHRQAKLELEKLLTDRAVIAEQLEQRIRAYIYQTGNSYEKIRYARDAAEAARKTLDLVTKSYLEGLASILDVIDAQNTTLIAEELVADNMYNFLQDLMNSQRATNRFDFLLSEEERQATWQKFDAYLQEKQ
ncbi:MAG: TolC family protein [bacterium]|nr:TolC family protein [bacterium]